MFVEQIQFFQKQMLKNLRLLDLSRIIVGPYASMVLSDFGIEVIKIQSEDGDPTRQWGPPWHQGTSAYFHSVNRNKQSLALNLKKDSHREVLYRLVEKCDAVVENFVPGTTESLHIDYPTLKKYREDLVYCSISGYGDIGPLKNSPAFDNIIQAQAGFMHLTGSKDTQPFKMGFAITDVITSLYASNAILGGLLRRQQTGKGIHIKTSLLQCAVSALINQGSNYLNGNINPKRMGNHHPNILPYGLYQASDCGVVICVGTPQQYQRLLQGLKIQSKQQFATNKLRVEKRQQFDQHLNATLRQLKGDYIVDVLRQHNVPCGKVNSLHDCFNSDLAKELGLVRETEGVKFVRSPLRFQLEQNEDGVKETRPPKLNQHRQSILRNFDFTEKQIQQIFGKKTTQK